MYVLLTEEEKALNLKAKNLILRQEEYFAKERELEQKARKRKLLRLHIRNIVGSFYFVGIVSILAFVAGGTVFINAPEVVGCDRDNVLCQKLRLRQPKVDYE